MSQLNQSAIKKIQQNISYSCFTISDFDIKFPESGALLILSFKHKPTYEFRIIEKTEKSKVKVKSGITTFGQTREEFEEYLAIYTVESPGYYKSQAKIEVDSFEDAIARIRPWCTNIKEDLSMIFENTSEFEEIRSQFEEQFKKFAGNENERFSADELKNLNKKFDTLLSRFELLEKENKITKDELNTVKKEVETFKENAENFPKGIWAKVTNNRFIDILVYFAKSKEGQQLIIDEVKKMIGM